MLLFPRDVSQMLGVSESQVFRWIERDGLPARQVREQFGINSSELLEWATRRQLPVDPDIFLRLEQAACANGHPHPLPASTGALLPALARGGVAYRLSAVDRRGALLAAARAIRWPTGFDLEGLSQLLLVRDQQCLTAVGGGIAIPHPRAPMILPGEPSMVLLAGLEHAIEFGAPDGEPVDTLFLIVCPTIHQHLWLLAELSGLLADQLFRGSLRRRAGLDELLTTFGGSPH